MTELFKNLWPALLMAPLLLTGCFNEPPACSDMEVAKTLKNIVLGEVQKPSGILALVPVDAKTKKLMDRFIDSLTFSIGNVRSDGYNRDAKTRMCKAQLTVGSGEESQAHDIAYTIQLTENKDGDSMVFLEDVNAIAGPLASARGALGIAYKNAGEWSGTYQCGGIDGATSGPRGPFQQKVGFTVDADLLGSSKMERTTQGGGVETLEVDFSNGHVSGAGQNSPDDQWKVEFKGKFTELDYAGRGSIAALDGEILRRCELRLTQTPIAELPSVSKLSYMGSALR